MLLLNELRFCFRQPIILLGCVLLPLFAYILSVGLAVGDVSANKQLILTQNSLVMLAVPLILGAFSPVIMLRDSHANMQDLINVTPVKYSRRWLLRFVTVAGLATLLLTFSLMLILISQSLHAQWTSQLLGISVFNLLLVVLPAVLFNSAVALWLTKRFYDGISIYVFFGLLHLGYLTLASMTGSPTLAGSSITSQSLYTGMLWLDPYGITALIKYIDTANPFLNLPLLGNRVFYLGLTVVIIWHALKLPCERQSAKSKRHQPNKGAVPATIAPSQYQASPVSNKSRSPVGTLVRTEFSDLLHNKATLLLLCIWPLLLFDEVFSGIDYAEPMSVVAPTSIDALNRIVFDVVPVFGAFLLALWSWQICWREKICNIAELVAVTPVKNRHLLMSHLIVIWLMTLILLALAFAASSMAEWLADSQWIVSHYLLQLGLTGLPLLLLGSILVGIHHLCRSKALSGGVIALVLLVKFTPIMTSLGLTHTLWNIADSPLQAPDHFWGYSNSLSVYWPYMSFWLLITASLIFVAIRYSHRGTALASPSLKSSSLPLWAALIINSLAGLALHHALINEKPLMSTDKQNAWKALYESRFSHWQHQPQPSVVQIDSNVDIYPNQQFAKFNVRFTLENRTNRPVSEILIGRYGNYSAASISINNATLKTFDNESGQAVYQFSQPMQPGDKREVETVFSYSTPQLWPLRSHQFVKPQLSYLRSVPILPTIGYQPTWQIRDEQTRIKYDLPALNLPKPSERFKHEQQTNRQYQWVNLNSYISTAKGQYALTQGKLVSRTEDDKRVYFHYQTRHPVRNIPAWFSVPDSMLMSSESTSPSVAIKVFSTEKNNAAQLNLTAMTDTLNWFSQHIVPYRASQLSLVAIPDIGATGYALPQIILIGNRVGFHASPSATAGFDQRYRRAVHETAHQWFGHDIGNGVLEDNAFLVESMAKYVELVLIEQRYGHKTMLALVGYERQRFKNTQRGNVQQPLALIDATQSHDMYSRATLVFYHLRDALGDEVITTALKQLWRQHAYPKTPATSMDFVRALKQQSPEQQHQLIDQLLLGTDLSHL